MSRALFALGFALAGAVAATGRAEAAIPDWDRDEVMVVTGLVALAVVVVLSLVYAVKWYFGLEQAPPPPEPDEHAGHH
ncbi:MAG TPA: hypothetical protein VII57_01920 [Dehalococcoidia bacterium]